MTLSSKVNLKKILRQNYSREVQYAALNILEALHQGDVATSIEVLKAMQKPDPLQIDFNGIDTCDEAWDTENKIYNSVLSGDLSLPVAEFALGRVKKIDDDISERERIEEENAEYEAKLKKAREDFPEELKKFQKLNSFEKMQFEMRNTFFKELKDEYDEAQSKKKAKNEAKDNDREKAK